MKNSNREYGIDGLWRQLELAEKEIVKLRNFLRANEWKVIFARSKNNATDYKELNKIGEQMHILADHSEYILITSEQKV